MNKKNKFYLLFFAVLVLAFFAVLSITIPGFTSSRLPPIGRVDRFSFINQDGEPTTEKVLEGKVAAVNYFFTTCRGICPKMNNNLAAVYQKFKGEKDFVLLSFTSDPERDSAAQLKHYTDSIGVNTGQWHFLTGAKDSLYKLARYNFKIDDPKNNVLTAQDDFLHTQFVALVNQKGEVTKIFDALKPSEMKELEDDIQKLLNR